MSKAAADRAFSQMCVGLIGIYVAGKTIETYAKRAIENPENQDFLIDLFANISNDFDARPDSK